MAEARPGSSPAPDEDEPSPTGGRVDGGAEPADPRPSRGPLVLTLVLVLLVAVATVAFIALQDDEADLTVVIPEGTGELVDQGDDVDLLADEVAMDAGDTLAITNDDDRIHQIGDVVIEPGQTEELEFPSTGRFVYTCTIRPNNTITFVVT